MLFPDKATEYEKNINWYKIAEVEDADFGFDTPKEKTGITRSGVKVLLFNEKREICVIKSGKYGYMQLPGGGIEKEESISYVFSALPDKEVGTNYMDDEITEGFKPIWKSLNITIK